MQRGTAELEMSGVLPNDLLNNTYEQSTDGGISRIDRIYDDLASKERTIRDKQLKSCGAITMLITGVMLFAGLSSLKLTLVYYQVVKYVTNNKNLQLPFSYNNLEVELHQLSNGVKLVFINDPQSTEDAFSVNIPVGYFDEGELSPQGISATLATALTKFESKSDTLTFNRTVVREAQSTTWSGQT